MPGGPRQGADMNASYASDPAQSRGRLHVEPASRHRSAFQRDRDRIIHSQAFRRLKHKTQVFVEHEGDYFRTRLTHTIEVAQVARTISRVLGLNEDLSEAVALAHDLGHPPFGHTGEEALNTAMAAFGGFDHNAQALKIVTELEARYADFDGLNLSWECLEGIAKHNGPVGPGNRILDAYRQRHDLDYDSHAGAEAQVAALSDDIAYNNHDFDDGLRAGLFSVDEIEHLPVLRTAFSEVNCQYSDISPQRRQHEALRRVFGAMVEDVLTESARRLAASGAETVADVRQLGAPVIGFSAEMGAALRDIREFLFRRMYRHQDVMTMRDLTAGVVADLFGMLMEDPSLLPDDWADAAAGDIQTRAQVVADYVSGMTDRYALKRHEALTGRALAALYRG